MKLILKGMLCASLVVSGVLAKEVVKVETKKVEVSQVTSADIEVITSENSDGKVTTKSIEEAFIKAGFIVSANRDMNGPFKMQFKESGFDIYNLFTFYKADAVLELAKKYPNVGLFAPMSMSIYTKKGEKSISVSSLTSIAMAKIMKAPNDDETLLELRKLVKDTLQSALPNGKFESPTYAIQEPKGELVTNFTMEMDPEEWVDELDDLKMEFKGELATNGFVVAGFSNLGDAFKVSKYEVYDFYEVYSICKLPVIYTIAKTRPEAGAYAPCSLYLNKKKNDNNMHIGFPSVYNWMSSLGIENKENINILEAAQKSMENLLESLTE
jgi:uncharacterized protein (DUF302 family)